MDYSNRKTDPKLYKQNSVVNGSDSIISGSEFNGRTGSAGTSS